ncbi:nicotinate-nucleotide adenylyltransferase [Pseudoalteromonas sp. MMG005]|uniref:nicotinate-nucleotide adenylyltransferase n=1 Tax=Pseudoalteromonas sp. MMG005 TaxID=2822682 RepID=UPI001B3A2934|nr:nicotinate-nucleotide adenylyltransferase [Pseudoalteromonas sp. MMG005]MBQ4845751.1 nicotinate-nucleotide adenylyltransferase [Pseudoalteromonas sp. MMG005]
MIALFGGTFDPVHLGHINMAENCITQLGLEQLRFLPCAIPVHKAAPGVTEQHRLAMLDIATRENSYFYIDTRELRRQGPSYSLLSLQECRAEYPDQPLIFLMGMDSFNSLPAWFEWQAITSICHIVVYQRPGEVRSTHPPLIEYLSRSEVTDISQLHAQISGLCYFLTGNVKDVSSSQIRNFIKYQQHTEHLLQAEVIEYIRKHHLYAD